MIILNQDGDRWTPRSAVRLELEAGRVARETRLGEQLVDAALEGIAQALLHGG
jgi:hypothetical protein